MWLWVDRFGGRLFDASLSALALWSLAALAMLASRQPARRLRMARAAVVGSLALWPLAGLGWIPRLDVVGLLYEAQILPHPGLTTVFAPVAGPLPATWRATAETNVVSLTTWVARGLTLAYLVASGGGLALLSLGWLAVGWMTRQAVAPSAETSALYDALPFAGRRRPRLRVAERLHRPVLAGIVQLCILIPPELDRLEGRDKLRLGLLHELAHVEGGDPVNRLLANLAWVLWLGAPPLWWVMAQISLDQEFLADRRAAAGFGPLREYASTLLEFASSRAGASLGGRKGKSEGNLTGVRGSGSALFQRILMLMRCPFPVESQPPTWWSWGLPCLSVVVTLGVSSLSIRPTSGRPTGPPIPRHFQVSRLETYPSASGPQGRAALCELPVRLPESFALSVEIWGNRQTLSRTRLSGLLLIDPRPVAIEPDRWHSVRLRRDRRGVQLSIDDRPIPLSRTHPPLTTWLSVESAPDKEGAFQNLSLTW